MPLFSYFPVSVYCVLFSIVYLTDGLFFHKCSSNERYNFNILKKALFHNFFKQLLQYLCCFYFGVILITFIYVFFCCL